jgi:hypothetical protein
LNSAAAAGDMVTVEIGPDRQKFQVYKEPLVYYSEYFRKALNEPWKEAEGVLHIDDVEPGVFKLFLQWLYTQDMEAVYDISDISDGIAGESSKLSYGRSSAQMAVLKLYVFADRFAIAKLRKETNNKIANEYYHICPWYDVVIYAFDNLPPTYRILEFFVDTHCSNWEGDNEDHPECKLQTKLPQYFPIRVMQRYEAIRNDCVDADIEPCDYDEHDSDEEKKACQEEEKARQERDE